MISGIWFWAAIALATLICLTVLLLPVLKGRARERGAARLGDIAIYRDQLAEVDRELASGRLTAEEAVANYQKRRRRYLVRRQHVLSIGAAWIITVPASALIAGGIFWGMVLLFGL